MLTSRSRTALRAGAFATTAIILQLIAPGFSVATASTAHANAAAPVVLTEEDYYTQTTTGATVASVEAEYHKLHPNVSFQRTAIPGSDYLPHVLDQLGAKALPDILMLDNPDIPQIAKTGQLTPLASIGTVNDSGIAPLERKGLSYNGKLYALQYYTNTIALAYNKHMFAAAHLSPPTTWSQWVSDAKALTTKQIWGLVYSVYPQEQYGGTEFIPLLWTSAGLDGLDHLTSPPSIAALNLLVQMERDGSMSPENVAWQDPEADSVFATGHAAMIVAGSYDLSSLGNGSAYGVVPLPVPKAGDRLYTWTGGETYTIPVTDSAAAKTAALQFLEWLLTPANDAKMAVGFGGEVPTEAAALPLALPKENPNISVYAKELYNGGVARTSVLHNPANYSEEYLLLANAVDAAVAQGKSASAAFGAIVSQMDKLENVG